jgi:hypothetical protein
MATTTPNNGWAVPTSTDFVKDGAVAIETLGDAIDASVGTGLLAWTTFVPTAAAGLTVGNGTFSTAYSKIGKVVQWRGWFRLGTTSAMTGNPSLTLPFTAAANSGIMTNGYGKNSCRDVSANIRNPGACFIDPLNTSMSFTSYNSAGTFVTEPLLGSGSPFIWASQDEIAWFITYQSI